MAKVGDLVGDGLSSVKMWVGIKQYGSGYELNFGCTVKLTCAQDENVILDAETQGSALAITGAKIAHIEGRRQLVKLALED